VRQKLSLILTLVAWLLATGSQLDAVQAFAWVRMFAANAHELPLGAALERTFSPEGRCHLCVAVSEAKQQQRDNAPASAPETGQFGAKILLAFQPVPDVSLVAPETGAWPAGIETVGSVGRAAPPLPPPRVLAA